MSKSPNLSCRNIFLQDSPDIQKQIFTEKYTRLLLQYRRQTSDDTSETAVFQRTVSLHAEK